jgi:hypothetical protein
VLTLPLTTACLKLCNNSPFFNFTMSLYFVFKGVWPDLHMESQDLNLWSKTPVSYLESKNHVSVTLFVASVAEGCWD